MTRILRAALVASLFVSSMAVAQEVEMNMNIEVDEEGMPSANVRVKGSDGSEDTGSASVRVRGGGAHMEVKVTGSAVQDEEQQEQRVTHDESPVRVRRPPPPPPPPAPAPRDDGTCHGKYPMDSETFRGIYQSLKSQANEITRQEMSSKMLQRSCLDAAQFGRLLDLFVNELLRLDVAKVAAPRVVNPQHAFGFSSKWKNSILAGDYTEIISAQQ